MKIIILLLVATSLFAAPAQYQVYKTDNPPVIDGDIAEWNEAYFIDSLHGDDNVFYRSSDSLTLWTRDKFQMIVYMTWDSSWVYFAVKVIADDDPLPPPAICRWDEDAIYLNPGGQAMAFYLCNNGGFQTNPSSPYIVGTTLIGNANPRGNGDLPTYECAIKKSLLDPFGLQNWWLSVGTEDNNTYYISMGAEYTGYKRDDVGAWIYNPMYFPTYTLVDEVPAITINETHVFWYKAKTNNYSITDCVDGKGLCLPRNAVIHEGMIATGGLMNPAASGDASIYFTLRNDVSSEYVRNAFIWSNDLNALEGSVDSAFFRAEYKDGFAGQTLCSQGTLTGRLGVVDYAPNIDVWVWEGVHYVPETADWQDFNNQLDYNMGFDSISTLLAAEESLKIHIPAGRADGTLPSVLDSAFFKVDITDQINWILSNEGQYAIVFLVEYMDGETGKLHTYTNESMQLPPNGSDNPWTTDGNTAHLVVYGDLEPVSIEKRTEMAAESPVVGHCYPNPFNPSVTISLPKFKGQGIIQIYNVKGELVYQKTVQGVRSLTWDAQGLSSGVYILKARIGGRQYSRKLILQR